MTPKTSRIFTEISVKRITQFFAVIMRTDFSRRCRSTKAKQRFFCGHDHLNNMSLEYKGVRLTYGYSIDYLAYGGIDEKYTQRGCTVIALRPDGSFENKGENYYQHKYSPPNGIILEEEVSIVQN